MIKQVNYGFKRKFKLERSTFKPRPEAEVLAEIRSQTGGGPKWDSKLELEIEEAGQKFRRDRKMEQENPPDKNQIKNLKLKYQLERWENEKVRRDAWFAARIEWARKREEKIEAKRAAKEQRAADQKEREKQVDIDGYEYRSANDGRLKLERVGVASFHHLLPLQREKLRPDNRAEANRIAGGIRKLVQDQGPWEKHENRRLWLMVRKWDKRARGEDARFRVVGNKAGGLTNDEKRQVKELEIIIKLKHIKQTMKEKE